MVLRALVAAAFTASAGAATYFIDPTRGDDANTGTHEAAAWRSLVPVNSREFRPGDVIRFRAGGVWQGQLAPRGSGAPARPIRIDVYGGTARAEIHGPGTAGSAGLSLTDQSYWEISHLEISNRQPSGGTNWVSGVLVRNHGGGMQRHIYLDQCFVHDVNSPAVTAATYAKGKATGGIIFLGDISDVRVTRCHVRDVAVEGLRTSGTKAVSEVVFTDNLVEDVYGDGIVIHGSGAGARIARNVVRNVCMTDDGNFAGVWTYGTRHSVIEYNEIYGLRGGGPADGEALDADIDTDGDVFQYNYTHDNARGFMLLMGPARNIVVRYNISENDALGISPQRGGHRLIAQNGARGSVTNNFYNNVFYSRTPLDTVFNTGFAVTFRNNVVLLAGGTRAFNTQSFSASAVFERNCFFPTGIVAVNGPPRVAADNLLVPPGLVRPGAGGTGIVFKPDGFAATQEAYRLRVGSPLLGGAVPVPVSGVRDYWGAAVGPRPNIGADQRPLKR